MRMQLVMVFSFLCLSWPLRAMDGGGTVISIVEPQEENFGDFGGDDNGHVVIEMDGLCGQVDIQQAKSKFGLCSCGYDDELKKNLEDAVRLNKSGAPTKGKRKPKPLTEQQITRITIRTMDEFIKKQGEKLEKEKKQTVWLKISNVMSWGANCSVSTLALAGTLAAVTLTVVQAATAK